MKFQPLNFFVSLVFTAVMLLVVYIFDMVKQELSVTDIQLYVTVGISAFLMSIINYIFINYLLNFYGKRQIRKISPIFPEAIVHDDENNLNFKKLGERISEINKKNASELDTMKEMETYRKEYIGNVSHEMKTPLFSIQGYVETLMDGGIENIAIRDKYLERIEKSVERLLDIVKDLDMINQFESGEITLNLSRFDINNLVREIIDLFDLEAQKKNSKIVLQSPQNQIFIHADKQKISQVLINLISNAIHYANREQAKITIRTLVLQHKVLLEVEDNGMGIRPEVLPRIFERFYRIESSRNRNDGGSGLGLAIVKHILEAHNENISVESTYLEGTKFSFMLEKSIL
jgi:two-component system phosphate regulon sensor histidine kinase PhoR